MDPTQRFTSRVENYVRYRPTYPPDVVEILRRKCDLAPGVSVADVGSGTGIFSGLLLQTGATVYAVEPNPAMRKAAEASLGGLPGFVSVEGRSEQTGLADGSIALVTSAQAAHWFRRDPTRAEWQRILVPGGWVGLVWNTRQKTDPFGADYEAVIKEHSLEREQGPYRRRGEPAIRKFFEGGEVQHFDFPNQQPLNLEGLIGRSLSSSYAPEEGHPMHEPLLDGLKRIFDWHQKNGLVWFRYKTELWLGKLE